MKRIKYIMVIVLAMVMFCGCGNQVKDDAAFLTALGKGLENRWKISEKENKAVTDAEQREKLEKVVQCELDSIGNIEEYVFADNNLKELATDYVESLNEQKEAVALYGKDEEEFNRLFTREGYAGRAKDIYLMHNSYTIPVNKKAQDNLYDLFNLGKTVELEDNKLDQLNLIMNNDLSIEFNGNDYEICIENVTDYTYDSLECDLAFYDEEGVKVCDQSVYLNDFKPGDKSKEELLLFGQAFSSVQIKASYYRNYIDLYELVSSDVFDVSVANEYSISIKLDENLPVDVKYFSYGGKEESESTITDFSYSCSDWNDGKCYVELSFSGRKKSENPNGDYKGYVEFDWDLLDSSGERVDSDVVYITNVEDGETFKDEISYADSLQPGEYTLRLSDHVYE